MQTYIIDGKEVSKKERIEHLKKLSSEIREQIIKEENNLFSDEIDIFLFLLEIELKYIFLGEERISSQTMLKIKKAKLKNPKLYHNIERPD